MSVAGPVPRLQATACMTYFRSLTLDNLRAALYSLRRQNMDMLAEVVVVDNNTEDSQPEIAAAINEQNFPVPTRLLSFKHGDPTKTHSWSTNVAVREAKTPWVFFTRADYLLADGLLARSVQQAAVRGYGWHGFVTGDCYHLHVTVLDCDAAGWRVDGGAVSLKTLPGAAAEYTLIDTGVYLIRREAFEQVGAMNEQLTVWGHAQTEFQFRLHKAGVEMIRIPELLYFHPYHGAPRDLAAATAQLAEHGVDIKKLWERYDGEHIYR